MTPNNSIYLEHLVLQALHKPWSPHWAYEGVEYSHGFLRRTGRLTAPPSALPPQLLSCTPTRGGSHICSLFLHPMLLGLCVLPRSRDFSGWKSNTVVLCPTLTTVRWTHGTPRSCVCHMITAYIPNIMELSPTSTAVTLKTSLRVILWKNKRKARWLGNGHAESETGVKPSSGPLGDFQMMHILLGQDGDRSNEAADASPTWDEDSHRTSQWGTSYAECLRTHRFLPPRSLDHPALAGGIHAIWKQIE